LIEEMALTHGGAFRFDSLYIGGGTPTVLDPRMIDRIIDSAHHRYTILPGAEITMEANPGAVDAAGLRAYRAAGVNRINIGVQSFHEENLRFLGRIHSSGDARLAMEWAGKAGFDNLGIDLIYGLPDQTKDAWLVDLRNAVLGSPAHLSCYMLTYESGVPMDRDRRMGKFTPLAESPSAELFTTTIEFLEARGYAQYEISNFARSRELRSRHNQKYWTHAPYLGFGPSAHAFIPPERRWNRAGVREYIHA
ncbi:MAG: coproporphyrinogen III oxidase family protein, partial [Desulfobacterales bacterium]|nr:coproporphyrinogen III oxidase family protein [Desulfobacterales bacterium]